MARIGESQHPLFQAINSSISFDYRLAPYDIAQSRAHVKMLAGCEIVTGEDRDVLLEGLDRVEQELQGDSFKVESGDEDIHMAIERRLTEIVGSVGGKLHTARSRNDQVATDLALYVKAHSHTAIEKLAELMQVLLDLAAKHRDWKLPGYTHLQRAQSVRLSHHLLAYLWMFERDAVRFSQCISAAGKLPLGAGALAGVNWQTDRKALAAELGFEAVAPNSIDAVSNRDFALDYLSAAAICATHLSRLGAEIVLWSSEEFGFCEVAGEFASTSSIMPQKKNPDAAELLRAKAPRVSSKLIALLGVFHGLPLTYSKDMQEDKEGLFDAVDTLELCLQVTAEMMGGISFNRDRMAEAASDESLAATDIADLLVRHGVPFRQAHAAVADLVRAAVEQSQRLSEVDVEQLKGFPDSISIEDYRGVFDPDSSVESKRSEGGTASERIDEQFELASRAINSLK